MNLLPEWKRKILKSKCPQTQFKHKTPTPQTNVNAKRQKISKVYIKILTEKKTIKNNHWETKTGKKLKQFINKYPNAEANEITYAAVKLLCYKICIS